MKKQTQESLAKNFIKQIQHIHQFLIPFQMKIKCGFLVIYLVERELFLMKK